MSKISAKESICKMNGGWSTARLSEISRMLW